MWSSKIVVGHLLTSDRVLVVEGHDARVWPEHRVIAQHIWPIRIFWIRFREERHVVGLGVCPTFFECRVPKREVLQPEDLPYAILFDVLVLIHSTLPPLYQAARMCVLDAIVGTSRHHTAEAAFCTCALGIDIDYALHLWMIKEEAINRAITPSYEGIGESTDVQSLYALFAIVSAPKKLNACVRMVGV